ncbi:MAG: hypothetical protein DMG93_09225 [Acidobacteria bacterium]|nr:MAG: hypothetical protein DMG93_09225 [Acidobacteriota bacterium]
MIEQEQAERQEIDRFESGSISPESFRHADHVRLAFCYLRLYSPLESLQKFSAALKRFAQSHGKERLYHETITCAYLLLIHERMHRCGSYQSWEEFVAENPDLLIWKNGILNRYYTEATLQSDLARRVFVFPDKMVQTR